MPPWPPLRSHVGGAGEPAEVTVARGALAVRLNQLAAGGSGADPAWLDAVARAPNADLTPEFPVLGAIGTGDLTGLAATALALIGERTWRSAQGRCDVRCCPLRWPTPTRSRSCRPTP